MRTHPVYRHPAKLLWRWLALPAMLLLSGAAFAATTTADHSKFKELQQAFRSGPEVTQACLVCHTEAAKQIHKTKHWTWEFLNPANKQQLAAYTGRRAEFATPEKIPTHRAHDCIHCHQVLDSLLRHKW